MRPSPCGGALLPHRGQSGLAQHQTMSQRTSARPLVARQRRLGLARQATSSDAPVRASPPSQTSPTGITRAPLPPSRSPANAPSSTANQLVVQPNSAALQPSAAGRLAQQPWFYTETGQRGWITAMELDTLTPELPALLREMGLKYDPDRLAAVLEQKWPRVYARALKIATLLGGWIAGVAQDAVMGRLETNQKERAVQLRQLLSRLGPSFVKIGQALSARPDLLPKVYLDTLADLQDRLPSFPTDIARTVIETELGRPIDEMFIEISAEPVAAASLGQVYRARLRSTGEEVAVKVQRPSIGENIAVDMLLLRRLMAAVDKSALPALGISQPLVPLVDEFAGRLFAELDYEAEGHNAERFQRLYGNVPRVRTPAIKWDYTARKVLTMEWIDGVKLTNKQAMEEAGLSVVDFVDVGIECTLRQLLEYGYFHADPHPGNLLATKSGDLVYLDFGMMSEAPQYARYAIIAHVVHLVNRDYEAMCNDYYDLQFMDRSVDTSPIAPALASFFDNVLDQSVSQLNFKAIVDGLGEVLFRFPFRVPAYYALILRSLTVLEGLALQADPQYKLLAKAYPYMARRLLTDPAPELRDSFEDLVLKEGQFRWNRLDNLLREGSKSQDFDPGQLWLLAEWLLTPSATVVRESVVAELARMVDAMAAGDVRQRIIQGTGNEELAQKLVPTQPQELEALARAKLLMQTLSDRVSNAAVAAAGTPAQPALAAAGAGATTTTTVITERFNRSTETLTVTESIQTSTSGRGSGGPPTNTPTQAQGSTSLLPIQGSGPWGLMTPGDVVTLVSKGQAVVSDLGPRFRKLAQSPGAADLMQNISSQLGRRFTARAIKLVFGSQQVFTGAVPGAGAGAGDVAGASGSGSGPAGSTSQQ